MKCLNLRFLSVSVVNSLRSPIPAGLSNDRAETSPEGGVASTAGRPGSGRPGETASGRNGGQGLWSSRRPFAHSPFRLFAALRFSLFARKYAVESVLQR
jgi:hypothetical protein